MSKQAVNPFLPSWEYIPDGEPHVFNDRVYLYGSHDQYGGQAYCLNDYVCWSAPIDDLADWRYEGVIYKASDDPGFSDTMGCLFAPDVSLGPDGRYYLYYVLSTSSLVSVAVADTPAGTYRFLDYVHYQDGTRYGEHADDEPNFDPAVLVEDDAVYLYTGFAAIGDRSRTGSRVTVLAPDMLTIVEAARTVIPSEPYAAGTGFAGHAFFEGPSIRKIGDQYYLIYSSILMYELVYAVSDKPTEGFTFGGTIISNNDMGIDRYKPLDQPMFYGGNNHGSIAEINGSWYVFYHRHTNGTNYSRQACAERITILGDGRIPQVEMTSCGLNGGPLAGEGFYKSYIACNLFTEEPNLYTGGMGGNGFWLDSQFPRLMQDGKDGDEVDGYVFNMTDGATAGFKYFYFSDSRLTALTVRGYTNGRLEIKTRWDGEVIGSIPLWHNARWTTLSCDIRLPDGEHALYFSYKGEGFMGLQSFELKQTKA